MQWLHTLDKWHGHCSEASWGLTADDRHRLDARCNWCCLGAGGCGAANDERSVTLLSSLPHPTHFHLLSKEESAVQITNPTCYRPALIQTVSIVRYSRGYSGHGTARVVKHQEWMAARWRTVEGMLAWEKERGCHALNCLPQKGPFKSSSLVSVAWAYSKIGSRQMKSS